jgi:hypothetical protein
MARRLWSRPESFRQVDRLGYNHSAERSKCRRYSSGNVDRGEFKRSGRDSKPRRVSQWHGAS